MASVIKLARLGALKGVAVDAFEHGTLCVLRRHVVWWEHEVQLRALEKPARTAKPTRDASSVRNTTVVLPRRTVRLV